MKKSTIGCFICLVLALLLAFIITKQKEKENIVEIILKTYQRVLPPNPLALEVKKRHLSEIDSLENNLALQLKGVYGLACLVESWSNLWYTYRSILDSGKRIEPGRKEMVRFFGRKILECIEDFGLDLPEEAKQNLRLENESKESFNMLLANIERQLESQYGSLYRQLYLLVFAQSRAIVCFSNLEAWRGSVKDLVLAICSTLKTAAQELGIYPDLKEKLEKLEEASAKALFGKEILDEIIEISDKIFSTILSKFKEKDSWPENQAIFFRLIF